jgi:hypothetical protein
MIGSWKSGCIKVPSARLAASRRVVLDIDKSFLDIAEINDPNNAPSAVMRVGF